MQKVPPEILKGFNKYKNYSLLIFQFGLNVAAPETRHFGWYENAMVDVVNYYQKHIPEADVLIISIGDKSIREGMSYVTQPSIPTLVEAQRSIARRTQSYFWNLYQAMGGYNAMVRWVEAPRPLAAKDYAHINARGAEKISQMLSQNIVNEFKLYEMKAQQKEEREMLAEILQNSYIGLNKKLGHFESHYGAHISGRPSPTPPFMKAYVKETVTPTPPLLIDTVELLLTEALKETVEIAPVADTTLVKEDIAVLPDTKTYTFIERPRRITSAVTDFYGIHTQMFTPRDTMPDYVTPIVSKADIVIETLTTTDDEKPVFRVQFMASKRYLGESHYTRVLDEFEKENIFIEDGDDGYIRYMVGNYGTLSAANAAMQRMNEIGQDAFVTGWHRGQRISVNRAQSIISSQHKK